MVVSTKWVSVSALVREITSVGVHGNCQSYGMFEIRIEAAVEVNSGQRVDRDCTPDWKVAKLPLKVI